MESVADQPQYQFRPRACKASKVEKFGVDFTAAILLDESNGAIHPCRATSGKVFIATESLIQFREMLIQFEGFLTMPCAKNFAGSIPGVRQSIIGIGKVEPGGFQLSPVHHVMIPDEGTVHGISQPREFSFCLSSLRGNLRLPPSHDYHGCTLIYRFAVYMRSSCGSCVEICEKIIPNFRGYHNLLYNPKAAKHQHVEIFLENMSETNIPSGSASLSIGKSGYLPGESIPFMFEFKHHYKIEFKCYVQLQSHIKIGVFFEGSGVWQTKTREVIKRQKSLTWSDKLEIPPDSMPSCSSHPMFTTSNTIEFKVISTIHGMTDSVELVTGSVPVYIGTTRESREETQMRTANELEIIPAQFSSALQFSPSPSIRSLPPPYSLLSSRAQSMESLPPTYEELALSDANGYRRES